jgi:hypothetical protein
MAPRDGVVSQWIVEDRFCNGRPPLQEVGAELEHAGRSDPIASIQRVRAAPPAPRGLATGSEAASR